ncbi:glycosyltransferase [Candidatus Bathyarchaeota archaeon]|nr:glycosyltransferase [Candidatus Bathyarchaeota archaeon]
MVEIEDARIAHFGNLVNDAFPIVKALRDRQIATDLYVYRPAHVCSLPQWEVCDLDINSIGDPYNPNWETLNEGFTQPSWMHVLDFNQGFFSKLQRFWQVIKAMRAYDLLVAHVPFSIYAQFSNKPYISFDAGAIRYFDANNIRTRLFKRGYLKAKDIIVTNPDTMDLFDKYGFKYHFVPFLIDTSRYRYEKPEKKLPYEYVFFMPSRQYWQEKGNNIFIESFYQFHKEYKDSILAIAEWGTDLHRTKELIKKLGIEKSIIWLPLMSKPRLIKWYNLSTAIADQFVLGSYGTTAPEAMACEKPVITYLSEEHNMKAFGDLPPVLNARKKEDILNCLLLCTDHNFNRRIGEQSRKWIIRIHGPDVVTNKHLAIYKNIIEK